jgi:sigma-B regulation protein RsbU (phosphoserine phosphatase)
MARRPLVYLRFLWRHLNVPDRLALLVVLLNAVFAVAARSGRALPGAAPVGVLFFIALGYLVVRLLVWARGRLLWRLRNRLIVAYVFIAVVPVLLLLVMAALSVYILYWQLGAYVIYDDVQERLNRLEHVTYAVAATLTATNGPVSADRLASPNVQALLESARNDLPGLRLELGAGKELLARPGRARPATFRGLVQLQEKLWLRAVISRPAPAGPLVLSASVPVTQELLDILAPEMGPMRVNATLPADANDATNTVRIGTDRFKLLRGGAVATRQRVLAPASSWMDYAVEGVAKLDAVTSTGAETTSPVLVSFVARPSALNHRLFGSLGEIGSATVTGLFFIGIVFLMIEVAALVAGIMLTRTITHAVSELYSATEYVRRGDFTHRVRIAQRDQLGALAESFNSMTSSISTLIEEQRQRQRLENELSIARQVQEQLFPQSLPSLPGIEVEAICRAARMVSGDYYDFLRVGPSRLGLVIADISGKGISAALLMASLQAALRSQVLLDGGSVVDTAAVVARLNRHLYLNTSDDRYATLFYAVYDADTHTLTYTNAGHLPPLYIAGDRVARLDQGGTVVGLLEHSRYDQASLQLEPGGLLVAYSDGMIEPENVYGEEFGTKRLLEAAVRSRSASPRGIAEALMSAVEEWASSPEQSDDMTVIVARAKERGR